jgi:SAM-dependent methyltransferase
MAPDIVWNRLRTLERGLTVLDPMAGSGTTAAAAQKLRHNAIAFDSDPLAVRIARAWCACIDEFTFLETAVQVLETAKERESSYDSYPTASDDETKLFAEFWFDAAARKQLAALSAEIRSVDSEDLRALLWCAFSRMIVTKERGVSLAMDVSHSRPHRTYEIAPVLPFDFWEKTVAGVAQNKFSRSRTATPLPNARVSEGDARKLPLAAASVDVVITSPPYLNAIDYLRGHRLSLIWMGHSIAELRRLRSDNVGSEAGSDFTETADYDRARAAFDALRNSTRFARREMRMIKRYIIDLDAAISEVARVLKPDGRAIYVVGDCNLRGNFVANSQLLRSLAAAHGLRWVSSRRRELPTNRRYLPPPCSAKAGAQLRTRMGEEVVIGFCKE